MHNQSKKNKNQKSKIKTKIKKNKQIYNKTLWLMDDARVYNADEKSHFVWIKNFNVFFKDYDGQHNFVCDKCFVRFSTQDVFNNHKETNKCVQYVKNHVERQLPDEDFMKEYETDEITGKQKIKTTTGEDGLKYDVYQTPLQLPLNPPQVVRFKAIKKCLEQPFIIYYDFESILATVPDDIKQIKQQYQHHQPNNVGFKLVSKYSHLIQSEYKAFNGSDFI